MNNLIVDLSPIFLTFALGVLLRWTGAIKREAGGVLLRVVFFATLPALILVSVSAVEISADLMFLPVISMTVLLVTYAVSTVMFRRFVPERRTLGVTVVGSMIMNMNFLYPFMIIGYGSEGFARTMMFDFGNGLLVLTFAYYTACRYGSTGSGHVKASTRLLASPPLWAMLVALALNLADVSIAGPLDQCFTTLGNTTIPIVMLALGIYFTPRLVRWRLLVSVMLVRTGVGLLCGILLARIFGLEGLSRTIAIVCSAAPVGYNTLIFASLTELDVDFAASLVSTSILLGIIYVPVLMMIL
jgi:predicted permease